MVLKKTVNNKGLNGTTELVRDRDIKRQHAEQVNSLNLMVFLLRILQTQSFQTVDFKQRLKELLEA